MQSSTALSEIRRKVLNLGKITNINIVPDLIDIQFRSYNWFLQKDEASHKRDSQGLEAVFRETFPIESPNEDMVLEYVSYSFGDPKWDVEECKNRGVTYATPLKAIIRLINKHTGEVREQTVYMGDLPMMTEQGTFVINGAERVVVSQLHRSPGIFFFYDTEKRIYSARVIPYRGSWLELEMDTKGLLVARIDRKKKFPATLLLKAIGAKDNQEVLAHFYESENKRVLGAAARDLKKVIGRRLASRVENPETGEVIMAAGEKINEDNIDILKELKVKSVSLLVFPGGKDDVTIINCLEKDGAETHETALQKFHSIMRPGEPFNVENARNELARLFFSEKSYDLGAVGRYKINNKFRYHNPKAFASVDSRSLRPEDIVETLKYFVNLVNEVPEYHFDDIDHLGNRRVRSVGELLMNQLKVGFTRMERVVRERMTVQDIDVITPQALISIKPVMAVINEFFGSSQLSQFMDQTNPLSELTHKRRLNALGPGGLSRERAGFEVRDVHYSHYGRMCPIETPEGPNIGLIVSMSTFCRVNEYGFLETPYRKVEKGKVSSSVEYLTADIEEHYNIAQANAPLTDDNTFRNKMISCRRRSDFPFCSPDEVQFMDMAPLQVVSVSTALIPFLEHDDANRALMGSNMQRQAVPLVFDEEPFVGTGMEGRAAYDSRTCIVAREDGVVVRVDSERVHVKVAGKAEPVEYRLIKFKRSNQGTCVNQKPVARVLFSPFDGKVAKQTNDYIDLESSEGETVRIELKQGADEFESFVKANSSVRNGEAVAGQKVYAEKIDKHGLRSREATILADGPAVDHGRLALGKNVLVAFMPWEGYNFEDAILISERIVKEDVFSSIHIEEYEIQARETKLGQETITRDIPNLSDKAFRDLDENGVIRVGAEVRSGDILVGMVTPKGEADLTPEYKLLHSIFGEKAKEVRDTSLRMPNGTEGIVIDVRRYSRENGDELPAGVESLVKVYVAKKRKLQVGDKMAGRHGNKGVVARIMAEEDMPFMEDGTPMDIILNPLGVPSRMNIGQILETQLGFAGKRLNVAFETPVFDGARDEDIERYLVEAGLPTDCKFTLFDGRTGERFEGKVFCGYIYILKLAHLVDDKIHARSTGPYSLVTQQPLGGKAQFGGQRLGEMEVWALEAYGASHTLQELLTVKSDDMLGRARIYEAIVKGIHSIKPGVPESFNVLMQELRGLALDVALYDSNGERMELTDLEDELNRGGRRNKIKLETIERII
ncbi:MAG: DNA-directed RNA polymerase subunit beta [Spirochaetales bacterium]|nr:DNA-directed RNA polymerase subunit beta [Leptospiraceae bacterium]MCP5480097.1 DNA-directed RNA polymerase subunit beta [Spirochaetales bacterium]MCP5485563.1 DNA-directed RNA polymerase subunit beta [Spirochaetales bacterium]